MSMQNRIRLAMQARSDAVGRPYGQSDLARAIGVTPQTIQQWIAGKTSPRRARINKIATELGCDPVWLETGYGHNGTSTQSAVRDESPAYGQKARTSHQPPANDLYTYQAAPPREQVGAIRQILGTSGSIDMDDLRFAISTVCEAKEALHPGMGPDQFAEFVVDVYNDLQNGATKAGAHAKLIQLVRAA